MNKINAYCCKCNKEVDELLMFQNPYSCSREYLVRCHGEEEKEILADIDIRKFTNITDIRIDAFNKKIEFKNGAVINIKKVEK